VAATALHRQSHAVGMKCPQGTDRPCPEPQPRLLPHRQEEPSRAPPHSPPPVRFIPHQIFIPRGLFVPHYATCRRTRDAARSGCLSHGSSCWVFVVQICQHRLYHAQDGVPKAVMYFLVNRLKANLQKQLLQEMYTDYTFSRLMCAAAAVSPYSTHDCPMNVSARAQARVG
jgi:hypothetical protein